MSPRKRVSFSHSADCDETESCIELEEATKQLNVVQTWVTILKWVGGGMTPVALIFMGFIYGESQAGQNKMSVASKIKFATTDEQIGTIRRDIKALDKKIDERFDRLEKKIDFLK